MRYSSSRTNVFWWRIAFFSLAVVLVMAAAVAAGNVRPASEDEPDRQISEPMPGSTEPVSTVPDVTSRTSVPASETVENTPEFLLSADDGFFVDVLSPFDVEHPAIANLDPDLREALQLAATDAEADGVLMVVTSGWRSERYQEQLLSDAVVTYGSLEEARKWVNTPESSTHVTGDAVDIGYTDANYWMIENGSDYGLCQTYENETWHFELTVEPGTPCPPPLTDALEVP